MVAYASRKNIMYFSYLQYYKHTYIQCLEMHSNTRGLNLTSEELNNTDLTATRKNDDCPNKTSCVLEGNVKL